MNTGMNYKTTVFGLTAGIMMFGSSMVYASPVTIPNTFTSGTPAVAADVNANFDAVAAGVNDNDSRITTNNGSISTNASDIAALDARIAALESAGTMSVASLNGTYKLFSLDNGTGYHQDAGGFVADDNDVITEDASITFDGAGNFSGTIDNGADLARVTDSTGAPTYTLTDTSGTVLGGTYTVSGSTVTLNFTTPGVSTETAYLAADTNVFIMHSATAEVGTGWEFYSTYIRVGVKLAP